MDKSNLHAVIIGINEYSDFRNFASLRYSEKDAQDIYEVLTTPNLGKFLKENTKLILGSNAITKDLEKLLYTEIVKQRYQDDTVLVYFSGHGFLAGELEKAYLGTYDVKIEEVLDNPRTGLRMDFLHDEIFMQSPAERIIFILDCCHSGGFIPPDIVANKDSARNRPIDKGFISKDFFSKGKGKVAIVSSAKGALSRESQQLKNGLFTHYLVKGLKGEAAENNGEVTIDNLIAYVRRMISEQPSGRYGHDFGRFVITKIEKPPLSINKQVASNLLTPDFLSESLNIGFLANPLDSCEPFIDQLREKLNRIDLDEDGINIQGSILDIVKDLFHAEFAFIFKLDAKEFYLKFQSSYVAGCKPDLLIQISATAVRQALHHNLLRHQLGISYNYQQLKVDKLSEPTTMFIVPLTKKYEEFIVIAGINSDSPLINDIYAVILKALCSATIGLNSLTSPAHVEEQIMDDLKSTFKFLPGSLYNRRFKLFADQVANLTVHFQPIVYLDPAFLHICGWEALARDASTQKVPNHLFQVAEKWGSKFSIELDRHIVLTAPYKYREALSRTSGMKRIEDLKDLSVNVYPQSLISSTYYEAIGELVKQKIIPPENLILEISEKTSIPYGEGLDYEKSVEFFRNRLKEFIDNYRIRFAIDDFGSGHSSISRLLDLSLNYIKVDRSVMLSDGGKDSLSHIFQLIQSTRWDSPKVVIEGFDGGQALDVNLNDLYEVGFRFVQGYFVGNVGPELYRLDKSLVEKLSHLLGKNHE